MEILATIVVAIVFFYAGWQSREAYAMHLVHKILEEAEETIETDTEARTKMVLEKHGDVIYAYTDENHEFMAQGKDLFELDTAIQARFPGKKFAIQEDNLKEIAVDFHEHI